jgi:vancomycin resistance protein VanW
VDLFPDYGRVVPFGTGTSILYNYKDYRFRNDTPYTFQLRIDMDDEYITGRLLCDRTLPQTFHIRAEDEFFSREGGAVYRNGKVYRQVVDVATGNTVERSLIKTNHARVLYDTSNLEIRETAPAAEESGR